MTTVRAAVYVRVSTDHTSQKDSPDHQWEACREYAEANGLVTSKSLIYSDAGLSGMEMETRPEVLRLLADARMGKFDAVLFTAISRFSRDLADAFAMKKRLETVYGIRIISIEEGYDSAVEGRNNEMVFTVHAMLAAHKSKEMSVAIRRGLRQAAKRGRHIGNRPPYGYNKNAENHLVPDEQTAAVVRDIFTRYLAGESLRDIARYLNEAGIPTASQLRGRHPSLWQPSTVGAILKNPVYQGTLVAHKWTRQAHVETSRQRDNAVKRLVQRAPEQWVVQPQAHPGIIKSETFQAVSDLLQSRAGKRSVRKRVNPLAGLLKCQDCGSAMLICTSGRKSTRHIVCGSVRRLGKSACSNHIRYPYRDVLAWCLSPVQNAQLPFRLEESLVERMEQLQSSHHQQADRELINLERALAENQRRQQANLEAMLTGWFTESVVHAKQEKLKQEACLLRARLAHLKAKSFACTPHSTPTTRPAESLDPFNVFGHPDIFTPLTVQRCLHSLIKTVLFNGKGVVQIHYRCQMHLLLHQ